MRAAARTRGLPQYLAAAILVRTADEGARVALVLLAIDRLGSAAVGGVLIAALLVPHVVAAPVVGLLTDRAWHPRRVLGGAAVCFAVALALVAVTTDALPLPVVVGLLLVGGCCGPALTGALTSQLAGLVDRGSLPRAFGLDSLTYNISGIVGPALTAVLAGSVGPVMATLALAVSAACGGVVLAALPIRGRTSPAGPDDSGKLTDGLLLVVRDRVLGLVTAASSFAQLGSGALPVIAAVLATRRHDPAQSGWLMTAIAAGALLGSLIWTWRPASTHRAPMIVMAALVGVGAPLALAATASSLPLTIALFAASGVFTGPFAGALFAARQQRAPAHLRAQVFTVGAGLKTSTAAIGAALVGLVTVTPTSVQLLLAAGCPLLAGAVGAALLAVTAPSGRGAGVAPAVTAPR